MASHHNSMTKIMLSLLLLSIISSVEFVQQVSSFEFEVGDSSGWVVPPPNDTKFYNDWASEQRFKVGDTIRFKYKKDSVMEVNETEYKKCYSTHPYMFSNTGNSMIKLDRSGLFYFISGSYGHCEKGQRMIVKVLSQEQDSQSRGGGPTSSSSSSSSGSRAAVVLAFGAFKLVSYFQFVELFLASYLL